MSDAPPSETQKPNRTGTIVLVVGPSGAGKDSVIAFARRRLIDEPRFVFARRLITRPLDGTEDHEPCSHDYFEAKEASGCLALSWRAHGTAYGIRNAAVREIEAGRTVVANVSRRVIAEGVRLAPRSLVVQVTASPQVLAHRLQSRGRETSEDIAARLAREAPPLHHESGLTVCNDGPIEEAGEVFLNALLGLTRSQ